MPGIKYYAIIVAGGSGKRMELDLPKQFALLKGRPVLFHTLNAFHHCPLNPEIILVLNEAHHDDWKTLCREYQYDVPHILVKGGTERFHSVKNGLALIDGQGVVAIHDAVRPLVTTGLIAHIYEAATKTGNAIAAIQPAASVRYKSKAISRDQVHLIQTPQAFDIQLLKKAYLQPYRADFTDDATVAEASGVAIHLIEGDRKNIKITWPDDLITAEAYLGAADRL